EHAAEDQKRREAAETRNGAEQLAYSIEKLISENEDKLPEDVKTEVQGDLDALKQALAGDDDAAVKTAADKLGESQTKLGEAIYRAAQQEAPEAGAEPDAANDEDVVDAEVVEDDEAGADEEQK